MWGILANMSFAVGEERGTANQDSSMKKSLIRRIKRMAKFIAILVFVVGLILALPTLPEVGIGTPLEVSVRTIPIFGGLVAGDTIPLPDLVVVDIDAPADATTQHRIEVSWTVQNQGDGEADVNPDPSYVDWRDALYLSPDDQWDDSDIRLGGGATLGELACGASYTETNMVTIPEVPAGSYYLLAGTDWIDNWGNRHSYLYESNEENNLLAQLITIRSTAGICGDVAPYPDCNGIVNMGDVVLLLNYVGHPGEYELCCEWCGDVAPCPASDGVINMGDVVLLLNYVGHPGEYELCCG
jgi:hypothetical protein